MRSDKPAEAADPTSPIGVNPLDGIGDVVKDFLDFCRELINDPPIHGDWVTLRPCIWLKLGELREGETGIVQYEPGENTLEKDLSGNIEVGSKDKDPDAETIAPGYRIPGPAKVFIHLKLPEGDHIHGAKARLNVYPPKASK